MLLTPLSSLIFILLLSLNKVWKPSYCQVQHKSLNIQRVHLMSSIPVSFYTSPSGKPEFKWSFKIDLRGKLKPSSREIDFWLVDWFIAKEKKVPCIRLKEFHSGDFQSGISISACSEEWTLSFESILLFPPDPYLQRLSSKFLDFRELYLSFPCSG